MLGIEFRFGQDFYEGNCFDGEGFLFRHTFGKTLRGGGKCNTFMVKKCPDPKTCPVANLELHVKLWTFCPSASEAATCLGY